jgi:hypothetical protein
MTKSRAALSEQDLLASNPADYMNAEQLAFFRQRLLSVRDELDRNASRTAADMKETVAQSDPADRATLEGNTGWNCTLESANGGSWRKSSMPFSALRSAPMVFARKPAR